jgi:hypothetical protein
MVAKVSAWQCIGCGKIEAPQNCIGVCQDRKVEFVYASEHEAAMRAADARFRVRLEQLETLLSRLAHTTPRDGAWERSYRGLQQDARRLLGEEPAGAAASATPASVVAAGVPPTGATPGSSGSDR